jgi:hypothetical protein
MSVVTLMDEIVSFTHYFPKRGGLHVRETLPQEVPSRVRVMIEL